MTHLLSFSFLDRVRGIDTRHQVHKAIDALSEVDKVANQISRVLDTIDKRGKDEWPK